MARKHKLTPRKLPTQERSRATVDAILQAAAQLLVKRGWDALTTNAIARRAGVNIASVYQFFPNKEAIVAELERRHVAETRAKIAEVHARQPGNTFESHTRRLVEAALAAHRVAPELHRAFMEELPRTRRSAEGPFVLEPVHRILSLLDLPHPDLTAWLIGTVTHAAVHHGVLERPADVASGALVDELVQLLVRYIQRAPVRA